MSKAFTRESDDDVEVPIPRPSSPLPPGAKNYLTPAGERRLREALHRLCQLNRPQPAASPEDNDVKRRRLILDQQIQHRQRSLNSAVVVPPPSAPWEQVRFGATVAVRTSGGQLENYRLVGVDEVDLDRNWVSWISPIARALINARLGQRVRFKFPLGEEELEIVGINYE